MQSAKANIKLLAIDHKKKQIFVTLPCKIYIHIASFTWAILRL
jgi:hypothetical protein